MGRPPRAIAPGSCRVSRSSPLGPPRPAFVPRVRGLCDHAKRARHRWRLAPSHGHSHHSVRSRGSFGVRGTACNAKGPPFRPASRPRRPARQGRRHHRNLLLFARRLQHPPQWLAWNRQVVPRSGCCRGGPCQGLDRAMGVVQRRHRRRRDRWDVAQRGLAVLDLSHRRRCRRPPNALGGRRGPGVALAPRLWRGGTPA